MALLAGPVKSLSPIAFGEFHAVTVTAKGRRFRLLLDRKEFRR